MAISYRFVTVLIMVGCNMVISSCPFGSSVSSAGDCTKFNDHRSLCCFMSAAYNDNSINVCFHQPRHQYLGENSISFGGLSYSLDCGLSSSSENKVGSKKDNFDSFLPDKSALSSMMSNFGSSCGVERPDSASDCGASSLPKNSCCLYEYGSAKSCFFLGAGYSGETSYGGFKIICN